MTTAKNNTQILAYKGFNKDWTCRGYQYKVGETNVHDGKTKACESGFHACEYPLDVFSYYAPASSVFAVIEASGDIDRKGDDSKITSSKLTVKAEIGIAGLVKAAIEYTASRTKPSKSKKTNNDQERSQASNTGDYSAASVGGKESVAIATGYQSKAMGADSCAIVLVYRNDDGEIVHIRASKVGENGIKPNVWYSLDKNGDFFEAKNDD